MNRYLRRLLAYVLGDQATAEDLADSPNIPDFSWMPDASKDEALAEYAAEAGRRSAELAEAAVQSLQSKAGSLLTVLLTLTPISFVVTGLALSSTAGPRWARLTAFVLMVSVDLLLAAAAALAFIASGLLITGGLNLDRMRGEGASTLADLKASEANASHLAAQLSMARGPRLAADLFHARRLVVIAVLGSDSR